MQLAATNPASTQSLSAFAPGDRMNAALALAAVPDLVLFAADNEALRANVDKEKTSFAKMAFMATREMSQARMGTQMLKAIDFAITVDPQLNAATLRAAAGDVLAFLTDAKTKRGLGAPYAVYAAYETAFTKVARPLVDAAKQLLA